MKKYPPELILKVQTLRSAGQTYGEIKRRLDLSIPKSTLSDWCKSVVLPDRYKVRIDNLNIQNLGKARTVAMAINKVKREEFLAELSVRNKLIAKKISDQKTAKIALAMLCLGEASKYKSKGSTFSLGSSDPRIILIFLRLLARCYDFDQDKVRCTVQCRADQDTSALEKYWQEVTAISPQYFYKPQVDPRTIGKPTLKKDYKGVLRIDYLNRKLQLELESLADLIYNQVLAGP